MADNLLVKDATGANVTMRTKDVGAGVECSMSIPTDTSGAAAWGTAGTANANVMTIQGIASGTAVPISGAVTQGGAPWSVSQSGNWSVRVQDGSGNAITSTAAALDVNIKSGGGTGGTALADESTFTEGSTLLTPIGGYFQTSPTALTTTQAGAVSMTATRSLFVSAEIRGTWNIGTVTTVSSVTAIANALPAGTNVIGHVITDSGSTTAVTQATASSLNATVVGTGTFAVQAAQSGNWTSRIVGNAGGIVDFAGQNATQPANSILVAGEFNTTPTTISSGNASPLQLDNAGNLLVNLKANSFGTVTVSGTVTANAGTNLNTSLLALEGGGNLATLAGGVSSSIYQENVKQINGVTPLMGNGTTGTGSQRVTVASDNSALAAWGQGATAASVPSGAVYIGGDAATALPTATSGGQLTGAMVDKFGRQVALVSTIRDLVGTQTTTISASTNETTIVTQIASTFCDIIMLIVTNTSTATTTRIDFRDTTGGAVLFSLISIGGQQPVGFALPTPVPQTSVNTNWTAQCATSTTDVRIYAVFAKNK